MATSSRNVVFTIVVPGTCMYPASQVQEYYDVPPMIFNKMLNFHSSQSLGCSTIS